MTAITTLLMKEVIEPARTIPKETGISEALRLMRTESVDFFSVIDRKNRLIGALSEANLIWLVKHEPPAGLGDAVWFDKVDPSAGAQPVETIMTTNITTITPTDHAGTALKVMNSTGYRLLHVVDADGVLLGIARMRSIIERLIGGSNGTAD